MNTLSTVTKKMAKQWVDANVWDGDDRSGSNTDWTVFSPDELQELIDYLLEDLLDDHYHTKT